MRKEIFASLIGHAAELESQGRSFVDQQVSVSKKLVDLWKSEGTAYAAEVNDGRYLESDGKSGPPSWANDEQMHRDFATGVQILSGPDGLNPEALHAIDRKRTRVNCSHYYASRIPSSARKQKHI